jgi:DNA-binding transcriptional LysR family regulator
VDDLHQMRKFIAIAECGTFRAAADRLDISQSALSQSIALLEKRYDAELLIRSRRGAKLTPVGERLVSAAREAVALFDQARRDIVLMQNYEIGRLVIGADPYGMDAMLGPALARILAAHPRLRFSVRTGLWQDFEAQVRDGRMDLYYGGHPTVVSREFDLIEIPYPALVCFCRAGHPLTRNAAVLLTDLGAYPTVGLGIRPWFRDMMAEAFGLELNETLDDMFLEADDIGTVRTIVRESNAIAFALPASIATDITAGELVVLPLEPSVLTEPFSGYLVSNPQRVLPPVAADLKRTLKEIALEMSAA